MCELCRVGKVGKKHTEKDRVVLSVPSRHVSVYLMTLLHKGQVSCSLQKALSRICQHPTDDSLRLSFVFFFCAESILI